MDQGGQQQELDRREVDKKKKVNDDLIKKLEDEQPKQAEHVKKVWMSYCI